MKIIASRIKERKQKRYSIAEFLIIIDLLLIFIAGPISFIYQQAYNITYLNDIINVILAIILLRDKKNGDQKKNIPKPISYLMWIIVLLFTATSVFRAESLGMMVWASRRFVGYFIFFYACAKYWTRDIVKPLSVIYWINFIFVLIEFLFLGVKQDWIGGIFGAIGGTANSPLILFLIITTVIFFVLYLKKKIKLPYLCVTSVCSMIIAVIGELKVYFFIFAIILVLAILIMDFSIKKISMIVLSILMVIMGITLLYKVFPNFDKNYFTADFLIGTYATKHGYTGTHDVNRLYFTPVLEEFMPSTAERLFGLGLGNCSYIPLTKQSSDFYIEHKDLHYDWFSSSLLFIENGYVGLTLYMTLFILYFVYLKRIRKKNSKLKDDIYINTGMILALLTPLLVLYNNSMFQAEGYLVFFILATPFMGLGANNTNGAVTNEK